MDSIVRAKAEYGKVIETRVYVNHIVIEVEGPNPPESKRPEYHWTARTFEGNWQVGWELESPIRIEAPFLPGPVEFLEGVISNLEQIYGGKRVVRYMNPMHPDVAKAVGWNRDAKGAVSLRRLSNWRARGGQSKSEAKILAVNENLAIVNIPKIEAAEKRTEKYLALRKGGLKIREIAERENVSVQAVKNVLQRARKAEQAEALRKEQAQQEWVAKKAQQAAERDRFTPEQYRMVTEVYPGIPYEHLDDGSVRIDHEDGPIEVSAQTFDESDLLSLVGAL